jgi:hypothetical protein
MHVCMYLCMDVSVCMHVYTHTNICRGQFVEHVFKYGPQCTLYTPLTIFLSLKIKYLKMRECVHARFVRRCDANTFKSVQF